MKRGFTLVELAIVLVIIGLIMGMAIKGKSLIDTARVRAEIAKVKKIEAATATYYAKHHTFDQLYKQVDSSTNYLDMQPMMDMGLLSPSDRAVLYKGSYSIWQSSFDNWTIARCNRFGGNATSAPQYGFTPIGQSVCLSYGKNGISQVPSQIACYIEMMLDDESLLTGQGLWFTWSSYTDSLIPYADCDTKKGQHTPYGYGIF